MLKFDVYVSARKVFFPSNDMASVLTFHQNSRLINYFTINYSKSIIEYSNKNP